MAVHIPQLGFGLDYRLDVDLSLVGEKGEIVGEIEIAPGSKVACYYVPFNDPDYEFDIARGLSPSVVRYGRVQRMAGSTDIKQNKVSWLSPHVFEVKGRQDRRIAFKSILPKWHTETGELWFYNDYYPLPLENCPDKEARGFELSKRLSDKITTTVKVPRGWRVFHPGKLLTKQAESVIWQITGPKASFFLGKNQSYKMIEAAGTRVGLIYKSANFKKMIPYVVPFVEKARNLLGVYPYNKLLFVETENLEKSLTPGIITLNREKYRAQDDGGRGYNNWSIWQLASFVSSQWYGVSTFPPQPKDFWFFRGYSDFVAYILLKDFPEASNFFAAEQGDRPLFDFDYRQAQDLIASGLTFLHPYNDLTNRAGQTIEALVDQHAFGYSRHALALRYVYWYLGGDEFRRLSKGFYAKFSGRTVSPKDFIYFVRSFPFDGFEGKEVARILIDWWAKSSWPDFDLNEVISTKSSDSKATNVKVLIDQNSDFKLPVDVAVESENGKKYFARAQYSGPSNLEARLKIEGSPTHVAVNPGREIYDGDRFNNTDYGLKFSVFPGSARTLADDTYTVVWLPLFAKLPGESFSLLFGTQIFRYIKSSYTSIFSYVPEEERLGFQGYFLTDIPKFGVYTLARVVQDFGNSYRGERLVDAGLYKAPFFSKDPNVEVGLRGRARQTLGIPDTQHQTLALRLKVVPLSPGRCNYLLQSDIESTVVETKGEFFYNRNLIMAKTNCKVANYDLGVRGFLGHLSYSGDIPESVEFKPQNEDEARLRIDQPSLASVSKIASGGLDFLWPAFLPLPEDLFLLPRESRWRIFYDYAESFGEKKKVYEDGGVGFFLPFGADATGKRSIAFLQFSLLVVLHKKYDGVISRDPGIMIDFLGKL